MFRIQACITFVLFLTIHSKSAESFTATRIIQSGISSRNKRASYYNTQLQRDLPTSSPKPSSTATTTSSTTTSSSSTVAGLYSSQFRSTDDGVRNKKHANHNHNHSSNNQVDNRHSSNDYWYNIRTLPNSSILRDIRNPVLAVFGWSTVVSVIHYCFAKCTTNVLLQMMAQKMCISSIAHSFLISSLGLLLVFRTNTAYQRFYEGRKIWEQILSVSRNLSRLTQLYSREIGTSRKQRIRNLIASYPYLLRHHIRTGCLCEDETTIDTKYRLLLQEPSTPQMIETRYEGDKGCGGCTDPLDTRRRIQRQQHQEQHQTSTSPPPPPPMRSCWVDKRKLPWRLLSTGALDKISRARNRPLWICDRLGREICDIPYGPNYTNRERQHFLSHVEKLTNAIGQCERIHQTAVPLNYARHSLRSLTIWLFTLPFTMVKDLGFMTGPAAAIIAWLMFGVYEIGYTIEDPFQGSLRLSILCDAIHNDVVGLEDYDDDDVDDNSNHNNGEVEENRSRNSAYELEQPAWIDDACDTSIKSEILAKTILANRSPLFTVEDYQKIEK